MEFIKTQVEKNVLLIGLDRTDKMNAFNMGMLEELSQAYEELDANPLLRAGVLYSTGAHFTSGLDLTDVSAHLQSGASLFASDKIDPLRISGREVSKPVIVAVQGYCLTIGIELFLAADICVAAPETTFSQMEVQRGIFPFGGATIRMVQRAGWGNAMHYLLTGRKFTAEEAFRTALIQEIAEDPRARAKEIAHEIADQAPKAVQAILANARTGVHDQPLASSQLLPTALKLMQTQDAKEGLASFIERRKAVFTGK